MGALEEILYGALSSGVNKPTLLLLNVVLVALFLSLSFLLAICWTGAPAAVPHIAFLLFLFLGLAGGVNWLILSVGTVDPKDQRKELNLDGNDSPAPEELSKKTE